MCGTLSENGEVIMVPRRVFVLLSTLSLIVLCTVAPNVDASSEGAGTTIENEFPRPLDEYDDTAITTTTAKLKKRIEIEPFNLAATLIFLLAITHTFLTSRFQAIAHKWELEYEDKKLRKEVPAHFVHHVGVRPVACGAQIPLHRAVPVGQIEAALLDGGQRHCHLGLDPSAQHLQVTNSFVEFGFGGVEQLAGDVVDRAIVSPDRVAQRPQIHTTIMTKGCHRVAERGTKSGYPSGTRSR